jgi:hypothetical protein
MKVELDRKGLEDLVKGTYPHYYEFDNPLVKKAGHQYTEAYGSTMWHNLKELTEDELMLLYKICKDSWE